LARVFVVTMVYKYVNTKHSAEIVHLILIVITVVAFMRFA